jgi:transaldolase
MGVIKGVTTNPSLAAKEGIGKLSAYKEAVQEIANILDGPISVEVVSQDVEGMITEGRDIVDWIPNPWVKLPSTPAGIEAMSVLTRDGISVNQTLCFSVNQALLGAQAGSTVVSPFVGRLDDIGLEGIDLIADIASIYKQHNIETQVMAASIRHTLHCTLAAKAGAHISTIPYKTLIQMAHHPLTEAGQTRFLSDWQKASNA